MATAFLDEVRIGGQSLPAPHLENLKVRHEARRQGLGARLAAWRIEEAHRSSATRASSTAVDGVDQPASLATARRWSTQVLGPVRLVIAEPPLKPPRAAMSRSGR